MSGYADDRARELPSDAPSQRHDAPHRWISSRTRSIWHWQLAVAVAVSAITVTVALLSPETFTRPTFNAGVTLTIAVSAAALAVPWHRLSKPAVALLPAIDIITIGLMAHQGSELLTLLWVFPVTWLATHYTLPWLIAGLCEIAGILVTGTLVTAVTPDRTLSVIVVLLALAFIGITITTTARRTRAFRRLLERQFHQLERTLRRVEAQEKRAMALFNSVDTALARVDRRGVVRGANHAYRRLYAIGDVANPHPTSAVEYDTYRGNPLPPQRTMLARAGRGELFDDHRFWLFDAEGMWHALDATTSASPATPDEPEVTLLALRDVTAAVTAEQEKSTMTTMVSHELRNPLTAIIGHIDLLLDRDDLPADAIDNLTVVENAGQRMQRLITSVLDGSAPTPPAERVDLRRVVAASVDAFHPVAQTAQLTVEPAIDPDLHVSGDAFRLRQVVDNILGNAVKYTPRGGQVRVEARRVGREVRLTVSDTGIGISPADIERVFEPYFRAETARASGIPGTGLGMVISREIVHEHGGRLELTSALGHGTDVVVHLTAVDAADAERIAE